MSEIKLIAIDMDGTLMAKDHLNFPPINKEALELAHSKGIELCVATGRGRRETFKDLDYLKVINYLISENGASLYDYKNKKVLRAHIIEHHTAMEIVEFIDKYNVVCEIYTKDGGRMTTYSVNHFDVVKELRGPAMKEYVSRFDEYENAKKAAEGMEIEKFSTYGVIGDVKDKMLDLINHHEDVEVVEGFENSFEITKKGNNKGKELQYLAEEILHIKPENVLAFGDSKNDIAMFHYAGNSFAMLNGYDAAKAVAKNVTEVDNDAGGVGKEILKLLR